MKNSFSLKIHENKIFSIYSVKMVLLLPANISLPFCKKLKDEN